MAKRKREPVRLRYLRSKPRTNSDSANVRAYVKTVDEYCRLIESHRRVGLSRFIAECGSLLADLCSGTMRLPKGERDDEIFERRMRISDALNPDVASVIAERMKLPGRPRTTPHPRDPIVRGWMREARRDPERIAPVRSDPYFKTVLPFDTWEDLFGSLCKYLGPRHLYSSVFSPYEKEGAIESSLADDLAGIHGDVKEALLVYRKGSRAARRHAIWMWRFHFHGYWAWHATMAMHPVTRLIADAYHDASDP